MTCPHDLELGKTAASANSCYSCARSNVAEWFGIFLGSQNLAVKRSNHEVSSRAFNYLGPNPATILGYDLHLRQLLANLF